jgi:hypothetical protein
MANFISTISYFSSKLGENTTYGKAEEEIVTWEKEDLHVYAEYDGKTVRVQIRPIIDENFGGGDWETAYQLIGWCEIHGVTWICEEMTIAVGK